MVGKIKLWIQLLLQQQPQPLRLVHREGKLGCAVF